MSLAFGLTSLYKALSTAAEFIGGPPVLHTCNAQQLALQRLASPYLAALPLLPELEGIASRDLPKVNQWLRDRGFSIQLQPTGRGDEFAVAAVSDITVTWIKPGRPRAYDGHPGFALNSGVRLYTRAEFDYPLICAQTTTGDVVNLLETDRPPNNWQELLSDVEQIRHHRVPAEPDRQYTGILAPMVLLQAKPDLSWLIGLKLGGFQVTQAVQEVRFGMNHVGARAMEATAMMMTRGLPRPEALYPVHRSFLIWIDRPGVDVPLFQAHITPEHWQNPGNLAKL